MTGASVGAIWAQSSDGLLGADGRMLWRVPADFKHFKATTLGGAVVMGRTTWDSIGGALPGRASVVLTRRPAWAADGATAAGSLSEALGLAAGAVGGLGPDPREESLHGLPRVWVIGGGSVYEQALAAGAVDVLVLTSLDLDAGAAARAQGLPEDALVRAPAVPGDFARDAAASDPDGRWRPVSGDAAWRVDVLGRR